MYSGAKPLYVSVCPLLPFYSLSHDNNRFLFWPKINNKALSRYFYEITNICFSYCLIFYFLYVCRLLFLKNCNCTLVDFLFVFCLFVFDLTLCLSLFLSLFVNYFDPVNSLTLFFRCVGNKRSLHELPHGNSHKFHIDDILIVPKIQSRVF